MKKILLSILFLLAVSTAFAQEAPLGKGEKQLNFGVGLSSWGVPIYGGFDIGVHPDITLGGEISYRKYKEYWGGNKKNYGYYNGNYYSANIWGFSFNGNYHFNKILKIPKEWDFYLGLNLGYLVWNYHNDYRGDDHSGIGLGGQIGGRYYFSEKFGLNLEMGGGNTFSSGKFGATIKF